MKQVRVVLVPLLFAVACGDLPPPSAPSGPSSTSGTDGAGSKVGDGKGTQTGGNTGYDLGGDDPPAAPNVDAVPGRYGYDTIPLRGKASPYLTIFVEGGQAPVATDSDANGDFCIDVPLKPEQQQTLSVYAQNESGATSEAATVHVEQDPTAAEVTVVEPPVVNIAEGAVVHTDTTQKDGQLSSLTDGDLSTSVLFKASTIWIDLGATHRVQRIELVFPDSPGVGDTFATEYMVLSSNVDSPTIPPADGDYGWDLVFDVYPGCDLEAGDGGTDSLVLSPEMQTRYVGIYLIENNQIDWFDSENIRLSELRIFGRPLEAPTQVQDPPSCADGATAH